MWLHWVTRWLCHVAIVYRILWVAYYANIWVYPILKVLQPHQKVVFILAMLVLFVFLYLLGEFINKTIWGKLRERERMFSDVKSRLIFCKRVIQSMSSCSVIFCLPVYYLYPIIHLAPVYWSAHFNFPHIDKYTPVSAITKISLHLFGHNS